MVHVKLIISEAYIAKLELPLQPIKKIMQDIRNIAIIAHVDHGKTTLVDRILHQVKNVQGKSEYG